MEISLKPNDQSGICFEFWQASNLRWLGFDKHKNLLFGVRYCRADLEIYTMSILQRKVKLVKRFPFSISAVETMDRTSAISSCGSYIAVMHSYHYQNDSTGRKINATIFMLSVETGETKIYEIHIPFPTGTFERTAIRLYHTPMFGWMCLIRSPDTNFTMHQMVLNDLDNTYGLKYLTKWLLDNGSPTCLEVMWPIVFETKLLMFHINGHELNTFDYASKSWMVKKIYNIPEWNHFRYRFHFVVGCAVDQSLIAVPIPLSKDYGPSKDFPLYKLIDDHWEAMPIILNIAGLAKWGNFHGFFCNQAFCCGAMLVMTFIENLILPVAFGEPRKISVLGKNIIGLPSLKNLAMKCIFDFCVNLNDQQVMEFTDLPYIIKRRYFGPQWMW